MGMEKHLNNLTEPVIAGNEAIGLEELVRYGESVFEEVGKFQLWFRLRNAVLGNEIPAELVETSEGRKLVMEELHRIDYAEFV